MTQREVLERSMAELSTQVEKHRQLMHAVLNDAPLQTPCPWSDCRHQQQLLTLLAETVQTLDETRKSFKSKQLEQLRRRLLRVLAEETGNRGLEHCG